ncbi:MAG: 50S ribosomal protein L23 [Patescibacteria group bacterium]
MGLFSRKKKEEKKPKPEETANGAVPVGEGEIAPPAGGPSSVKLPKGEDAHSYQIILRPMITEKGGLLEGYGQYLFRVAKGVNKVEIKKAVEKLYKVRVDRVNVTSMPSKFRRVGEHEGKKSGFKKAIVTLKKGDKIEIAK